MPKPRQIKRIAVFCGSSTGRDPRYRESAFYLGQQLAQAGIGVVYGGSKIGLMGALAEGALAHNGTVIGVLPEFLGSKEIAHEGLSAMHRVTSMHERKMKMHELSDAVIALPGGFGTLEELFEMLTWSQLGLHAKPMGVLNVAGYFQPIQTFIQQAIASGLIHPKNEQLLCFAPEVAALLEALQTYQAPPSDLQIRKQQS